MYTVGIFFFLIAVLSLFAIIFVQRRKNGVHTSNPGMGASIAGVIFGLVFIGIGLGVELRAEGLEPMIFSFDFGEIFGDVTPLVQLVLNPFFSMGLLVTVGSANGFMIIQQLNNEGLLTIPFNFRVERDRDPDSSDSWEIYYSYLDGYRGKTSFTESQMRELRGKLQFLTSGVAQLEDVGKVFMVQYLEHDPTYHRFWQTKRIPRAVINANKAVLSWEIKDSRASDFQAPKEENPYGEFDRSEYFMEPTPDVNAQSDAIPLEMAQNDRQRSHELTPAEQDRRKQKRQNTLLIALVGISVLLCLGLTVFVAIQQGWLAF